MLKHALKEWAVVCRALAEGKQAILLRKGGVSEKTGVFDLEQTRFWLYPTYVHQQRDGVREDALATFDEVEAGKPPAGTVRLRYWAEATGLYQVRDLTPALMLAHLHVWSDDAVRRRFEYREPGLNVLAVRVYQAPQAHELPETAAYQGCRSWVELERELPTEGSLPVLGEAAYRDVRHSLELLLLPRAWA